VRAALARRKSPAREFFSARISEALSLQQVSDTKIFSNVLIFFFRGGKGVNVKRA
jgi:hypothetical protein